MARFFGRILHYSQACSGACNHSRGEGCVVTPKGWWRDQQSATDSLLCAWASPRRRVAVQIHWPRPARVDSEAEAEGDRDAICHITCSKPVSSGCIAGVSHETFCPEGSAQHCRETPPQELGVPWRELVVMAHLSVLRCALRGECNFHLFLLYAKFLALKMQTCSSIFSHSIK